jgi:hypothetical protein
VPRRKIVHDPPLPPLRSHPNPQRQARSDDVLDADFSGLLDDLGEVVLFRSEHSRKSIYPAIIQEVFDNGSVRLFIISVSGFYHQIATEGDNPGNWFRREPK